jgi:hypothetical protein
LVLCRDCLVHFSYSDIRRSLTNIRLSRSTYILTTTFRGRDRNFDVPTGDWRAINLEKAPFDLGTPLAIIDEQCTEGGGVYSDKCLGLWRCSDL